MNKISLILIALIFTAGPVLAEDSCEWTVCEKPSESAQDRDSSTVDDTAWTVPTCTQADRRACSNECSNKFSDEYADCVNRCLSGRCSESEKKSDRKSDVKEALFCVETESAACLKRCSDREGSSAKTCRRACLTEMCPGASSSEIIDESLNPGSVACNRCKLRELAKCRTICLNGPVFTGKPQTGLVTMGCEQLCIYTACSDSCIGQPE